MSRAVEIITTLLNYNDTSLFSSFYITSIIIVSIWVIENIQFIYIFQKLVVCTKLDVYAFITGSIPLQVEY